MYHDKEWSILVAFHLNLPSITTITTMLLMAHNFVMTDFRTCTTFDRRLCHTWISGCVICHISCNGCCFVDVGAAVAALDVKIAGLIVIYCGCGYICDVPRPWSECCFVAWLSGQTPVHCGMPALLLWQRSNLVSVAFLYRAFYLLYLYTLYPYIHMFLPADVNLRWTVLQIRCLFVLVT